MCIRDRYHVLLGWSYLDTRGVDVVSHGNDEVAPSPYLSLIHISIREKKMRSVKVTLKAGYSVLLLPPLQ